MGRTIGAMRLFGIAAIVGAVFALSVARPLWRYGLLSTKPRSERLSWLFMLVVGCSALFVYLASVLNRAFPSTEVAVSNYPVVSKHCGSRSGCSPAVVTPYGTESFKTSPFVWQAVDTQVQFVQSHGNLSFERVVRIRAPQ
jgi:hypothetical protein